MSDYLNLPNKRATIPTTSMTDTVTFESQVDVFWATTHLPKLLSHVFDVFKDNVTANLMFGSTGLSIFALYHCKTVCTITKLGRDIFSDFSCPKEVLASVNLMVLAKKINTLLKFKANDITFKNDSDDLVLTGRNSQNKCAEIKLRPLDVELEELDVSNCFQYNVSFRVRSAELARYIECMPDSFEIYLDGSIGCLMFVGKEVYSVTKLPLMLDGCILSEINKYPDVKNYRASFTKHNLSFISKGVKLSDYAVVSISNDSPLCIQFVLLESSDLTETNQSTVTMYFSPQEPEDDDMPYDY
jgi:hypothetical protein